MAVRVIGADKHGPWSGANWRAPSDAHYLADRPVVTAEPPPIGPVTAGPVSTPARRASSPLRCRRR